MSISTWTWGEPSDVGPFTHTQSTDYEYAFDVDLDTVGNFDIGASEYGSMTFSPIGIPSVTGSINSCRIRLIWDSVPGGGRNYRISIGSGSSALATPFSYFPTGDSGYPEMVLQIPLANLSVLNSNFYISAFQGETEDQYQNIVPYDSPAETLSFKGMWLELDYTQSPLYPIIDNNPATTTAVVVYLPSHFNSSTGYNPVVNTTAAAVGLTGSPLTTSASAVYFYRGATYTPTLRPSSATYTGTTPNNPTYAYDTTSTTVDNSTHSNCTSTGLSTQVYSFSGTGTVSGTLHVKLFSVDTDSEIYTDKLGKTQDLRSSVSVAVSLDGGINYQTPAVSFPSQVAVWPGTSASNVDLTKTMSGVTISAIRVKVKVLGIYNIEVGTLTASVAVSDIVIL